MNAQISILDGTFTLIHIPLPLYPLFLQPILRVLLPQTQSLDLSRIPPEHELEGLAADHQHGFLNVSVTPIECSIVCHSSWAANVFRPVLDALPAAQAKTVSIFKDSYLILSVISAGLDAAGRVMELSSPLALAGIPIFFITTYYSDFILVPTKERQNVIKAMMSKGFELGENQSSFVTPAPSYGRKNSSSTPSSSPRGSPPLFSSFTVSDLQTRTFDLLQKRSVAPTIDNGLELVQCSGREPSQLTDPYAHRPSSSRHARAAQQPTWVDHVDTKLYTSIISALVSQPRFLSLTLAQDDPPSLLLDKKLLPMFGDSLIGDIEGVLIPIFLDLVTLPFEVTGIVCGVAGKLVQDMKSSLELSYLSTTRAGTVVLPEVQSIQARAILEPLLGKDKPS